MDKKYTDELVARFPWLFRNPHFYGFSFGDGWYELVKKLCEDIEAATDFKVSPQDLPYVAQAKEKFGGLRFYTNNGSEAVYQLISEAETKSSTICEYCGQAGKIQNTSRGWLKCMCDQCKK